MSNHSRRIVSVRLDPLQVIHWQLITFLVDTISTSLIRLARFGIIRMFRLSTAMDFGTIVAFP